MTKKQCENCKFYDEDIDTQPCCSCVEKQNFEADRNVGSKMESKDINIKRLEENLNNLYVRLLFNYNNNKPFEQYEEDRLDVFNAVTIIERLQKKIDKLKRQIKKYKNDVRVSNKTIKNQQVEIEKLNNAFKNTIDKKYPHCVVTGKGVILTENLKKYDELIADIYNEAYKEYTRKLLALIGSVELSNLDLRRHINNLTNELTERGGADNV